MDSTNTPNRIQLPFADTGTKNTIPVTSNPTPGGASFTDGFPPVTMIPIAAGGIPPYGQDVNGILYDITAIQRWQSAGSLFAFDATFSTAIGGYPKGCVLIKADTTGYWQSIAENNTNNPDTGGAGWISLQGNLPGFYQVANGATLPVTAMGSLVDNASLTDINFFMPLLSAVGHDGAGIWYINTNDNTTTIQCSGSDKISSNGALVSSITVSKGASVRLVRATSVIAGTVWLAMGTAVLKSDSQFAASVTTNGWRQLPNGDIEQWGQVTSSASADVTVAFSIAFPNAVYNVTVSAETIGVGAYANYNTKTVNNFKLAGWLSSGVRTAVVCSWRAIGK